MALDRSGSELSQLVQPRPVSGGQCHLTIEVSFSLYSTQNGILQHRKCRLLSLLASQKNTVVLVLLSIGLCHLCVGQRRLSTVDIVYAYLT